jgi:hypothetical protein
MKTAVKEGKQNNQHSKSMKKGGGEARYRGICLVSPATLLFWPIAMGMGGLFQLMNEL